LKAGRYEGAAQQLEHVVQADPMNAAARYYLGYSYYVMSQRDPSDKELARKATREIEAAYRLQPGFKPSWGKEGTKP
jgi:hypothetical protein